MNASHSPPTDLHATKRMQEALEIMLRTDGWKVLSAYLEGQLSMTIQRMASPGVTPDELMRCSGTLNALQTVVNWPQSQVAAFAKQIQHAQERTNHASR